MPKVKKRVRTGLSRSFFYSNYLPDGLFNKLKHRNVSGNKARMKNLNFEGGNLTLQEIGLGWAKYCELLNSARFLPKYSKILYLVSQIHCHQTKKSF